MIRRLGNSEPRRRQSFDADEDVWDTLDTVNGVKKKDFINDAIRMAHRPPYRLVVPFHAEEATLEPLLAPATKDIIFIGSTLAAVANGWADFLEQRVRNGLNLTFITLDPTTQPGDALYEVLERQFHGPSNVQDLLNQLSRSTSRFKALRTAARGTQSRVRVMACNEPLRLGLVMVDPYTVNSRMRVNLYSTLALGKMNPFLEIDPQSHGEEGRKLFSEFHQYFTQLEQKAHDLGDD